MQSSLPAESGEIPDRIPSTCEDHQSRWGIPTSASNECPLVGCKEFLRTCDQPALSGPVVVATIAAAVVVVVIVVVHVPSQSVSTDLREDGGTMRTHAVIAAQKDIRLLRPARGEESLTAAPPAKVRHHLFLFSLSLLALRGTRSGATVTMVRVASPSLAFVIARARTHPADAVEINKKLGTKIFSLKCARSRFSIDIFERETCLVYIYTLLATSSIDSS